jgi:hypothetical protein
VPLRHERLAIHDNDTVAALRILKTRRVLRGGSWNNTPQNLRSANRNRNTPDNRNNNTGFRIASTALSPERACLAQRTVRHGAVQGCAVQRLDARPLWLLPRGRRARHPSIRSTLGLVHPATPWTTLQVTLPRM